ncbi:hypothetical protein [Streptomyces sp. Tu 3180]|uniref:hypothetical protein n=1 Tax=Streptomyces sp. Tu 3180 TaxID=2682611 RepID=UPI0013576384|nr:hypothetical protein [Streptomyces sp. Tu 3180]KAF3469329.1 hypothetical protein GL259_37185 [Streptomyces sp. Tu 3180]
MIKVTWALVAEHVDEWTGEDITRGAAVLESEVAAVIEASGMTPAAIRHFREDFLGPVVEALRSEAAPALARNEQWSKAAGPLLAYAERTTERG